MNPSLVGDVEVQVVVSAQLQGTALDVRILVKGPERKWNMREASFESGLPPREAVADLWPAISDKVLLALKVDVPQQVA
jgi:hypothetical protein